MSLNKIGCYKIRIDNFLTLLKEALGFKSKLAIALFPFQLGIYKLIKRKRPNLLFDVYINNENGLLFCGKNYISIKTAASSHEEDIKPKLKIGSGIFIDIGANIGKYSIYIGKLLQGKGKVIAVEPEPNNFEILKKNIQLNKLDNVIPLDYALFSKNSFIDFYTEEIGGGLHSIVQKEVHTKKIRVRARTLDSLLKELKIKKVDLIKIDAENAEVEILRGAKKTLEKSKPKIVFEAWDENLLPEAKKILTKKFYRIENISGCDYFAQPQKNKTVFKRV
jgi:FkbM family methyltransferase